MVVNALHVAQQINTALNDALKKASAFSTVKTSCGNQHTYPVYGKNPAGCMARRGEIRLENRDFRAAGEADQWHDRNAVMLQLNCEPE